MQCAALTSFFFLAQISFDHRIIFGRDDEVDDDHNDDNEFKICDDDLNECSRNQQISTKTKVGTILDCISLQISFTIVYRRPSKIVRANKKLKTKPCAQIRVFTLNHFI